MKIISLKSRWNIFPDIGPQWFYDHCFPFRLACLFIWSVWPKTRYSFLRASFSLFSLASSCFSLFCRKFLCLACWNTWAFFLLWLWTVFRAWSRATTLKGSRKTYIFRDQILQWIFKSWTLIYVVFYLSLVGLSDHTGPQLVTGCLSFGLLLFWFAFKGQGLLELLWDVKGVEVSLGTDHWLEG